MNFYLISWELYEVKNGKQKCLFTIGIVIKYNEMVKFILGFHKFVTCTLLLNINTNNRELIKFYYLDFLKEREQYLVS